ncbi:MAG: GNAT family N-acetyltransferase [Clostridia bacterium]
MGDRHTWVVRQAEKRDAAAMLALAHALFAEPGLYIPVAPDEFALSVKEEEAFIERHQTQANAVFLLAFDADGRLVGMLNAHGSSRRALRHAVAFGMSVARDCRGQGVGTALLSALLTWARGTNLVTRIELNVYEENVPARRLYERFGFEVEGRRRSSVFQDGRYHDDLVMARLL